jgi:hypothetical protein
MSLAADGNFVHAVLGQLIYGTLDAIVSATAFTILLGQFKTGTKYGGSSMAWSVSTAIFDGTTLMINELPVGHLDLLAGPGLYMSLSAFVCLVTVGYTSPRPAHPKPICCGNCRN